MRKSQVLVVAVALLFCSAVAVQAQGIYEVVGTPVTAREGGAAEKAGGVVLFLRTGDIGSGTVTVQFSADLAAGTAPMVRRGSTIGGNTAAVDMDMVDMDDNTVMVDLGASGLGGTSSVYTIHNVRLDLRDATVPVTATVSGDENAIVSGVVPVVSSIEHGLEVEAGDMASILTRGGSGMATVTVGEAFRSAFTAESHVILRVSGVPDKATLDVMHVQPAADATSPTADVANTVTLAVGADNTADIVTGGDVQTAALTTIDGDGEPIEIMISFSGGGPAASALDSVMLALDLMSPATAEGRVSVAATMAPEEPDDADMPGADEEYFDEVLTDAVALFTFEPASCTLLYPYVVSLPNLDPFWDTGIAVTNPSAMTANPLDGAITFTLFMNGAEEPMVYTTGAGTPRSALNDEGMLEAGNTYTVRLAELLAWVEPEFDAENDDFVGHLFVNTDFTHCRGVGWVTDFQKVNQAYLPYFQNDQVEGASPVPGSN